MPCKISESCSNSSYGRFTLICYIRASADAKDAIF